ncbi:MAG TPA: 5-formyltetrahydrofolate cyclo-ligase [Anaeromyxobacter sp.]
METSQREAKRALRSELIARRARLSPDERTERSRAVADRIEQVRAFRDASVVAVYAALGTEVDPAEIVRRAVARGVRVAFPRAGSDRRLAFAICAPGELVRGPLGAAEPPRSAHALELREVGCVVMPGVAFSEDGLRLGRGGGYYDATLRELPGVARVGLAFDVQIVPTLPREAHDAPMDAVVTESRVLSFRRESR